MTSSVTCHVQRAGPLWIWQHTALTNYLQLQPLCLHRLRHTNSAAISGIQQMNILPCQGMYQQPLILH